MATITGSLYFLAVVYTPALIQMHKHSDAGDSSRDWSKSHHAAVDLSTSLKQFFSAPSLANVASRKFVHAWRRSLTWTLNEEEPNLHNGDVVEKYGQKFIWSSLHKKRRKLQPLRQIGDPDCDAVLSVLDPQPDDDILEMLFDRADASDAASASSTEDDKVLRDFVLRYSTVPTWVDWNMIRRGQQVFIRYLPLCGLALFYISLVGGFSVPLITKVLRATGYLTSGSKRVLRRLADTGHMICECVIQQDDASSLQPKTRGEGWKAMLRVRFLHGMVRRRLSQKSYWRSDLWGVPINQEDMAATLLAFSYNVLIGVEMILGHPLSAAEENAYIHFWRYVGWVMGVQEEYNPCVDLVHSKAALESIVMHLLEPDHDSIAVAHHLIRTSAKSEWSLRFRYELCRCFLGDQLADELELPRHKYMRHLVTVFLYLLRAYGWVAEGMAGRLLETKLLRLHSFALRKALDRGRSRGSTHQLQADPPVEYSAEQLKTQGRRLSTDSLPSPSPFSSCPFNSISTAFLTMPSIGY